MAHPQPTPQYSPPPHYSPHPSPVPTPPIQTQYPPNKRPQLSPGPGSPYGPASPQMANGQMPNPYFPQQYQAPPLPQNGYSTYPHPNAPPTPTGAVMGPPSRPVEEKPADLNDLSDVLFSTGIDIRSEEAALVQRNYSQQHDPRSFETLTASFNSGSSSQGPYYDNTPYLSQNSVGDRGSFYGAGTLNQAPVSPDAAEQALERARKEALRNKVAGMQHELKDPFLYSRALYKKLLRFVASNQVKYPDGLAIHANELQPPTYQGVHVRLPGPQPNLDEHLVAIDRVGTNAVLPSSGAIADITSLISLAAKERIRSVIEESASLARGRRINSLGIVPVDLKEIATGRGEETEIQSAVSPHTTTLKRSFSEMNGSLPTPLSDSQKSTSKTTLYPNELATALMKSSDSETALEEARAAKRSKRNVENIMSADASRSGSVSGTPGPGTPGTPGERAPDVPKKGLSKKEQKRQADAKANEAQQHAATSSSLSMALGGGNLFGGKKISWMSSKKPSVDTAFGTPRVPPAVQKAAVASSKATAGRKLGEFREDKEGGSGIQMRDLLMVLEPEPKEKRSLAKAYHRLGPGAKK